ncbi:TIGR02099 family protein [Bordetella holmesii]|uniref:TIGR02099 family protein n=3 Tax=Bordetella holmesii TaxID=35814 RepID=A0A158M6N6_9BORD|nr:YhdP family protein [Bordetella holmesii]EWM48734.1 hypothetical protein D556_0733 [Bordetella holmesii 41130]AMD44608.1 hypothetical protein H558_03280 [Bordetella holmesii H558]AUL23997.1 TIGR02099 family protein [Bordetella holmesii]AUL27323.1 TIGR02099 family protein [Bordetella holmesii]AUL30671.1 TIGR02099 family protein [Bordetella holmesii]
MRVPTQVFRWLFWGLMTLYVVAAIGLLGLRYWVLPRADEWRPRIEQYASQALDARVTIDHLSADWTGLNPRLTLKGVRIQTRHRTDAVLNIPSVGAVLSWRSMLRMSPSLLTLRVDGADIALQRDKQGQLWVAGQSFDLSQQSTHDDSPWLNWLGRLGELTLYDTTVRWLDESRQVPEIALTDLDLLVRNGRLSHRFSLRARASGELASGVTLRGEFNRGLFASDPNALSSWSGQIYAELRDAEPLAWRPWIDVPDVQGRMSTRAWLQIDHGKLADFTMDAVTRGLSWQIGGPAKASAALAANRLRWRLQGMPGDVLEFDDLPLARSHNGAGMHLKAHAEQASAYLPEWFEFPDIQASELDLDTTFVRPKDQPWRMELSQLRVANEDEELKLYGTWRAEGKTAAGTADLRGSMMRAHMNAIHKYLPLEVNADARQWLAVGLPAGEIRDAAVTIQGDLADFPYAAPGVAGAFRIAGHFSHATVDYAPASAGRKAWPRLEQLGGSFAVDKASLTLDSPGGGRLPVGASQFLTLGAVSARIPDMENNARLHLDGASSGPVAAYLALAANSPLGGLLDDALSESSGTGDWRVPLTLDVPLLNAEETAVQGQVIFSGNNFRFMPEIPVLEQVYGTLDFSDRGIEVKDIQAQFLGGPVRIWGKMEKGSEPLRFEGTLAGHALTQVINARAMKRFSGKTAYQGQLNYQRGGAVDVSARSDLMELAIDMPAPVGKKAGAALPLKMQWTAATDAGSRNRRWLTGSLGENINVLLERDERDRSGTYFARGALGMNRAASLPRQGLTLAASLPEIDVAGWEAVIDEFDEPAHRATARKTAQPTLPPLNQVNLATPLLRSSSMDLTDLKLFAQRPAPAQWRVDLESRQATGRLEWTEGSGAIAGHVVARLKSLSLAAAGDSNKVKERVSTGSDLSDIPGIDLQVQDFSLYDKPLGSLQLRGTNTARGRLWQLEKLQIQNTDATLHATGSWKLDSAERGLTVQARVDFKDVGKFLDRIGVKEVMAAGVGSVEADFTWGNLPWTHNLINIRGQGKVSIDKGRFLSVNSRTARLLELLSLQSLQRLAKLEFNPSSLVRDGFPFDTLRGDMALNGGVLKTEGYRVTGPVADIALSGNTNIISERWDLKAVVVPNLDASGAAVATALVNPLVGLGAFVTQWLLKKPLERAMTQDYKVTGSWEDPKVEPVTSSAPVRRQGLPNFDTGH